MSTNRLFNEPDEDTPCDVMGIDQLISNEKYEPLLFLLCGMDTPVSDPIELMQDIKDEVMDKIDDMAAKKDTPGVDARTAVWTRLGMMTDRLLRANGVIPSLSEDVFGVYGLKCLTIDGKCKHFAIFPVGHDLEVRGLLVIQTVPPEMYDEMTGEE